MTAHLQLLARLASGHEIRLAGAGNYDWYTPGGTFLGRLTRPEHDAARLCLTLGHCNYSGKTLCVALTDAGRARLADSRARGAA